MSPTLPGEMPREKLLRAGRASLSDEELLALFLRTGMVGCNVLELAAALKKEAGSLASLASLEAADIQTLCKGIGLAKATTLSAVFELGRRAQQEVMMKKKIVSARDVYNFLAPEMHAMNQERLVLLLLDIHSRLIVKKTVATGSLTQVLTHPRDIFREVIKYNAHCFILAHNHPSGTVEPSEQDRKLTAAIYQAGAIMHIPLIDHVIIGRSEKRRKPYFSFRERRELTARVN